MAVANEGGNNEKTYTILEAIELPDDGDDDSDYGDLEEVPESADQEDDEETLDDINRLLQEEERKRRDEEDKKKAGPVVKMQQRPQVIDDFFRNFLKKYGMSRSLEVFQMEWYELQQSGKVNAADMEVAPDELNEYTRNQDLDRQVGLLTQELERARSIAAQAKDNWDKFRKERDYHRMHHRRVQQEKKNLIIDLKRLKKHYEQYEPTLTELRHKYEVAMKEKMLMRLERDRYLTKAEQLQKQLTQVQYEAKDETFGGKEMTEAESSRRTKLREAPWPAADRRNPYANANFEPAKVSNFKRNQTFKGHQGAISRLAFHPKLQVVATACDDHTWKMWSMPEGQLVLSGEGHRDWVSGIISILGLHCSHNIRRLYMQNLGRSKGKMQTHAD